MPPLADVVQEVREALVQEQTARERKIFAILHPATGVGHHGGVGHPVGQHLAELHKLVKIDQDLRNADWLHGNEEDLADKIKRVQQAAISEEQRHAMFYRLAHPEERARFARAHGNSFHSIGTPTGYAVGHHEIDRYHPTKPLLVTPSSDRERVEAYVRLGIESAGGNPNAKLIRDRAERLGGLSNFAAMFTTLAPASANRFQDPLPTQNVLWDKASAAIASESRLLQPAIIHEFLDHWQGGVRREPWATLQQIASEHFDIPLTGRVADRVRGLKINNMHYHPILAVAREYLPLQYEHTLAWYRSQGITHVDLFRGVAFERGERPSEWNGAPPFWESRDLLLSPLTSWSNSIEMAREFTTGKWGTSTTSPDAERFLLAARVPVERIVGNGIAGLGATWQGEHVILGGRLSVAIKREDLTVGATGEPGRDRSQSRLARESTSARGRF